MHENDAHRAIPFISKMVRPFRLGLSIMTLVAIFWALDLSLRPYILKIILDNVSTIHPAHNYKPLIFSVIMYFLLTFIVSTIFRLYDYFVAIKMIPPLRKRIINYGFHHLMGHSHSYFQNHFSGSLANKINDLANNIPEILQIVIDRFLSVFLAMIFAIYTLWLVNIKFAIIVLAWSCFFAIISYAISGYLNRLSDCWSELGSTITGKIVDTLSSMLSVRLFARQKNEETYLNKTLTKSVYAEQKLQWVYFWIWLFYGYSFVFMQGLCLYFLVKGYQAGHITVGDFALVLSINIGIVDFLWQLAKEFSQFSKAYGKIIQALRTLSEPHEITDKIPHQILNLARGQIDFKNVHFHYKEADPLFEDKSITIYSGQKVGLVGFSGSGKTTFTSLILRLYDINKGIITIDEQNIADVTQASLHEAISMIPQDPSLFHRTLMENIRYGRLNASDEDIYIAAKKAHAHEFILAQPQGYQSMVGERGIKLSGGQRQRIAIARAILKNAPILILDEATSQLDSITENLIQESLWQLMQGKTTLVIAHRLSTLLTMDRILVFNDGEIVQDGTHKELLKKEGIYQTLWEAQVGGFIPD